MKPVTLKRSVGQGQSAMTKTIVIMVAAEPVKGFQPNLRIILYSQAQKLGFAGHVVRSESCRILTKMNFFN